MSEVLGAGAALARPARERAGMWKSMFDLVAGGGERLCSVLSVRGGMKDWISLLGEWFICFPLVGASGLKRFMGFTSLHAASAGGGHEKGISRDAEWLRKVGDFLICGRGTVGMRTGLVQEDGRGSDSHQVFGQFDLATRLIVFIYPRRKGSEFARSIFVHGS